ncbi:MAG TPA: hypothetical protein VFE31_02885 [Opitutaceae bacterium]|jgi:hypothetical protein|nr:hypothetical protein [Opitutaceae bacterium]
MRPALLIAIALAASGAGKAAPVEVTPEAWPAALRGARNGPGDVDLVLGDGVYPLAQALRVAGRGLTLRAAAGASPLLEGTGAHFTAVAVDGAPFVRIEGIHFRRFDIAVALRQDRGVRVADDWFDDVHTAIVGQDLAGAVLTHDRIDQAGGTPIVLQGGETVTVSDNLIFDYLRESEGGAGILVDGVRGPAITGNIVRDQFGPGAAIWARRCFSVVVQGNAVLDAFPENWRSDQNRGLTVSGNYWQQGLPAGNHLITFPEQARSVVLEAGVEKSRQQAMKAAAPEPGRPGACSRVTAWAGDRSALIAWHPPQFDGGAPILAFAVHASTGQSITITAADFSAEGYARLDELANGKPCTFTIVAVGKAGRSDPSAPSPAVTPHLIRPAVPSPPRILGVVRDGGVACIRYAAPASDGGARITSYTLTILPDKSRDVFAGRNVMRLRPNEATFGVIDELAQDGVYGFSLTAVNVAGESKAAVLPP